MNDFISFDVNSPSPSVATPATDATAANAPAVVFFDPPMCCSTGLCGPTLDQSLLDVSDMIRALQADGLQIERYQIATHPHEFLNNPDVLRLVREKKTAALPITTVWGQVIKVGAYPTLTEVQSYLDEVDHS